jgi:hypothetical protein
MPPSAVHAVDRVLERAYKGDMRPAARKQTREEFFGLAAFFGFVLVVTAVVYGITLLH